MLNLLQNAGFDAVPDWDGWDPSSSGAVLGPGRTGQAAQLLASYVQVNHIPPTYVTIEGYANQQVDFRADRIYVIGAWVRTDVAWGPIVLSVAGTEVARMETDTAGEWVYLCGLWQAVADGVLGVQFTATVGTGVGAGQWSVDDCEVWEEAMARGAYLAYKALFDAYKTLNGATGGYYTNLGSRVYPRLIFPDQLGQNALPYACLPLMSEQPPREVNGRHVVDVLRQKCVIFLAGAERSMDPSVSTVRKVLDAYDDQMRLIMPTAEPPQWRSGTAIQEISMVGKSLRAGLPDGIEWGESWVTWDLVYIYGRENLGPAGT